MNGPAEFPFHSTHASHLRRTDAIIRCRYQVYGGSQFNGTIQVHVISIFIWSKLELASSVEKESKTTKNKRITNTPVSIFVFVKGIDEKESGHVSQIKVVAEESKNRTRKVKLG